MSVVDRTLLGAFVDNNVCHRILGRRLYPFSLWHRFLLVAVESPFLKAGQVTLFDLREAVGICSMRYPDSKVRRPWIMPFLISLLRFISKKLWHRCLVRTKDNLLDYFGDYISRPEYSLWRPDPSYSGPQVAPPPRLGATPEVFQTVADVISFLHCSSADAWNTPVGQGYWWQMAYYKQAGESVNFMDESEREFQEAMRKSIEKGAA